MSGSFYNDKGNISWILNQYRPENEKYCPLQSTPFASSSLAAVGSNYTATDHGSQIYSLKKRTEGIPKANIDLYSTDKSSVGLEWTERRAARNVSFSALQPTVTVPNIFSLRSKYTL
jgi:hypothetical protein